MHKLVVVTCLLLLWGAVLWAGAADPAADKATALTGTWSINNWNLADGVQLSLTYRKGSSRWEWSSTQSVEELEGLTKSQLHSVHATVSFTMKRDAGTFTFEGGIALGIGRGSFSFVPDPTFASKLTALGYEDVEDDAGSLMMMAMRDVSLAFAGEVKRAGIEVARVSDLVRLLDHGVSLDSVRAFGTSGYTGLTAEDVVRFTDHGIDGKYLRGLSASGASRLRVDEIIRMHDHGIGPDYVARIRAAGYGDLSPDEIIRLHDHGVD